MNTMTDTKNLAITGKQRMTPSEAFVEMLVANGVIDVFGIVAERLINSRHAALSLLRFPMGSTIAQQGALDFAQTNRIIGDLWLAAVGDLPHRFRSWEKSTARTGASIS